MFLFTCLFAQSFSVIFASWEIEAQVFCKKGITGHITQKYLSYGEIMIALKTFKILLFPGWQRFLFPPSGRLFFNGATLSGTFWQEQQTTLT